MKRFFRFLLKLIVWFIALSIFFVILYRFVPVPVTPLMVVRCIQQKSEGKEMTMTKQWKSIDEISPSLALAVIASEDQKFTEHFGFDLEAIEKAQKQNERRRGKRIHGASTISQQTAKNVFLWRGSGWTRYMRKGFEVYYTFLIEVFWSKKRIMEVYLNVAEWGNGIYGAEAASQKYFNKPAKKLSASESAMLAAVLPNPRRWSPAKPTAYIFSRQQWIITNMYRLEKPGW
ncbi:MAG: monofunctional biosynthetic peptidoglycan transglycosylase [Bacteroidia bacterium]|nr:monofunctional biosynthetic peptidoglycan transglycosylase [Bacteroidia bacterium]